MAVFNEKGIDPTDATVLEAEEYWQHHQAVRKWLLGLVQVAAITLALSVGLLLRGISRSQKGYLVPYMVCVCLVKIAGFSYAIYDVKDFGFGPTNHIQWLILAFFSIIHMYALRTVIAYFNHLRHGRREGETEQAVGRDNPVMMHISGHLDDPAPPVNLILPSYDEAIKVLPKCPDYSETDGPGFRIIQEGVPSSSLSSNNGVPAYEESTSSPVDTSDGVSSTSRQPIEDRACSPETGATTTSVTTSQRLADPMNCTAEAS